MDEKQCPVKLSAHPSRGLIDEKMVVQVQNAEPFSKVTLRAFHCCDLQQNWESFAHYTTDVSGQVNVSEDPSLGGTYFGVEPMGLLWSLQGVKGTKPGASLKKLDPQIPMRVTITLYSGYQSEGFEDLVPLASVSVERWNIAPGVGIIEIQEDGVNGTLFMPPGPGPFPGIIDVWGYDPWMRKHRAALLGSHGFATLAVNYVTKETEGFMELDYFEKALHILQQHPQVLESRIGMAGHCFGNLIVFKLLTNSSDFKPACVVAVSAMHLVPADQSLSETRAYLAESLLKSVKSETEAGIMRDTLLPISTDPALKMDIKEMMEQVGKGHLVKILSYPRAGHILQPPYMPLTTVTNAKGYGMQLWGGEPHPHSLAQEDSWRKTLMFLHEHLYKGDSEN
ncbi:bile acid-CoA:amino acid N-acyltransferase-like [Neosynchiropus ocellatus]